MFRMSRGSKMGVGVGVEVHFGNYLNLKEAELEKMKSDARHRHETVNRRLKVFGVLDERFRHDLSLHSQCFRAVAVIVYSSSSTLKPMLLCMKLIMLIMKS